jgi:hypothetical protein
MATNKTALISSSKPLGNVLINLVNNLPVQKAYLDLLKGRFDQMVVGAAVVSDYTPIEVALGITGGTGDVGKAIYDALTNFQATLNASIDYSNLVNRIISA